MLKLQAPSTLPYGVNVPGENKIENAISKSFNGTGRSLIDVNDTAEVREYMPKLLVLDDNAGLLDLVTDWLEYHQFDISTARDVTTAKQLLSTLNFDLVIVDSRLAKPKGNNICHWYRKSGGIAPILMWSTNDQMDQKESAYEMGVDDYLIKPFELRELTIRINALLRRSAVSHSRIVNVGPLTLEPASHTAMVGGNRLNLTGTEFALLEYFGRHPNECFTTQTLLQQVWKSDSGVGRDTVRVYIKRLKLKLQAVGYRDLIQNIHGVGYKLDAPPPPRS